MHPSTKANKHADGRIIKHRASRACSCCRARKVRCDFVGIGIPCTNCRLDDVECVVAENHRRRGPRANRTDLTPPLSVSTKGNDDPSCSPCDADFPVFDNISTLPVTKIVLLDGTSSASLFEEQETHQSHAIYQRQESRSNWDNENRPYSKECDSPPKPSPSNQTSLQSSSARLRNLDISLPQYLKAVTSKFSNEDLEYLQTKGAFIVPETDLCNELLRCYTQHVHPYMPVIDLLEFLNVIERNQPENTVSLLLFQAVMFAAVAYIDKRFLKAHGYVSRRSARRAYYQRVKVLYDLDYEFDRLTCLQAVLLMTYWHENPDEPKDVWHWLAVAVSLCRTVGLNCDTSNRPLFSVGKRRLWRRIWWSCYIRDRLVAIALRRPTRISHSDFDVPMLELSDFETIALPAKVVRMIGECSAMKDSTTIVKLAGMCIELARLCVCISEVITIQYSVASNKAAGPQDITRVSAIKDSPADPADIIRCDRQLERWCKDLPPNLQFSHSEAQKEVTKHGCTITYVHHSILKGIYFTAMSALHRPQSLRLRADYLIAPELREFSIRKIRESADHIVAIYNDLHTRNLIRYLPNTGVTCLVPAILVYLGDIKSSQPNIRQAGLRKTQVCREALQALQDMYASAELARASLESTLRRTKFTVTPLTASSVPPHIPRRPQIAIHDTAQQAGFMVPSPSWSDLADPLASFSSFPDEAALGISAPLETERTLNDSPQCQVADNNLYNSTSKENPQAQCQTEQNVSPMQSLTRSKNQLLNGSDRLMDLDVAVEYHLADNVLGGDMNMQWLNWLDVRSNGESSINGDFV